MRQQINSQFASGQPHLHPPIREEEDPESYDIRMADHHLRPQHDGVATSTDYVEVETPRKNSLLQQRPQENRLEVDADHVETSFASKQAPTATDDKLVSFGELFSFADSKDKLLMAIGALGATCTGVAQPLQIVLLGDTITAFNPNATATDTVSSLRDNVNKVALNFVVLGLVVFVTAFLQAACWSLTASRQARRIRSAYVSAIITKEIGWFDMNEPMQLSTRVADSAVLIQEGMGQKVGDGIQFMLMVITRMTIGLVKGWELALLLLAFTPFIALAAFLSIRVLAAATQSGIESYGKAGAIAQEALSNVRTVHMFNSIDHFVKKYESALELSTKAGIKKGFAVGWGSGLLFFTVFCTYACGMFYGALKIANDNLDGNTCTRRSCYDGGRGITVFFAVIFGALARR